MPRTVRDTLKGHTAAAVLDLEAATDEIAQVGITFDASHPELADGLRIAMTLIDQAREVLEAFYVASWGSLPSDWESTNRRKGGS